jgi:hypothetical protein
LAILDQKWTLDETWRTTKLLRWFRPDWFLHSIRRKLELRTGLFLSLAAAIKCQRENQGVPPENLAQALAAVGIDEVPVDPYSGDPLKMAVIDNRVVVYSVGPDGDDDQAKRRFHLFGDPPDTPERNPDGDVTLGIHYALN